MLLYNEWVKPGDQREIKRYMETNENENTKVQNLGMKQKQS